MGKLVTGFVLGFLACVWTYGLNPTEAFFGFGQKIAAAHDHIQDEYRTDPKLGHKGQYSNYHRTSNLHSAPSTAQPSVVPLADGDRHWLSLAGGLPPM